MCEWRRGGNDEETPSGFLTVSPVYRRIRFLPSRRHLTPTIPYCYCSVTLSCAPDAGVFTSDQRTLRPAPPPKPEPPPTALVANPAPHGGCRHTAAVTAAQTRSDARAESSSTPPRQERNLWDGATRRDTVVYRAETERRDRRWLWW